jgi:hypothetical protein
LSGKTKEGAHKPKVFAWLDANASVLGRKQLHEGIVQEFNLTEKTSKVYVSLWRKVNGVAKTYKPRLKQAQEETINVQ